MKPALLQSEPSCIDVALVSMPWGPPTEPCLGLSILKSCLEKETISTSVFHMAPILLRWCTVETYAFLADRWGLNDFLFTGIIDPVVDDVQQRALKEQVELYAEENVYSRYNGNGWYRDTQSLLRLIWDMRERIIPEFIDYTVRHLLAYTPKIVGLTCLFDQTMASVALAKRLKQVSPEIVIVLGGYALEGEPSLTVEKAFPWIDLIVTGDGEQAIVDLAQDVLEGRDFRARVNFSSKVLKTPRVNLEESPLPDYNDWFSDLRNLAMKDKVEVHTESLPIESSRGCWWGQVQHCVFCGIDDDTLKYRQKSAMKTYGMLAEMRNSYGDFIFRFSDYIMPKEYYQSLLPLLAQEVPKYKLHSEIKANHPPERVKLLADAGFRELQPGIESFSTTVLREMHKGVTSILNVSLLKSGYLYEIVIHYNILYGLPGDVLAEYIRMLKNIPMLYHFIPPVTCTDTAITRFAPLQSDPARFGISNKNVHHHCYDMLFSSKFMELTKFSYDSYAYFFERNFEYPHDLDILYRQLCQQVEYWKKAHKERFIELSYELIDDRLSITDSRYFPEPARYYLSKESTVIYLECDERPIKQKNIKAHLEETGRGISESIFEKAVAELAERRLIWSDDDHIMGLAVPISVSDKYRKSGWCKTWDSLSE